METPKTEELLESLLLVELYKLGLNQDAIARFLGRRKQWVNERLKNFPRIGK